MDLVNNTPQKELSQTENKNKRKSVKTPYGLATPITMNKVEAPLP